MVKKFFFVFFIKSLIYSLTEWQKEREKDKESNKVIKNRKIPVTLVQKLEWVYSKKVK